MFCSFWDKLTRRLGTKARPEIFTCTENESLFDTENRRDASDTAALPPVLPPLELDPVGESGSGAPQEEECRKEAGESGDEEEEESRRLRGRKVRLNNLQQCHCAAITFNETKFRIITRHYVKDFTL